MAELKLFGGHTIRRLRKARGLTQVAMAEALGVSASYLNLLERNQRPLTARLVLALGERFDFDPRNVAREEPGGGISGLARRLEDPLFADLAIDREQLADWLTMAPDTAAAFARLYDRAGALGAPAEAQPDPVGMVRREIERWRNHFPDLDRAAEARADELRLASADMASALSEELRRRHQLSLRILPSDVMPDRLRRLDLHARQLQLSEMLDPASRTFQMAYQLAQLEQREAIAALVAGAGFDNRVADRMFTRHLLGYFAAALMMPYERFLRACETTGYDILVLQRRFGAGFEQVAHRLTTLQRTGHRGLPFFMVRIDRAGQFSKRYAGASEAALVGGGDRSCPLWRLHAAFEQAGRLVTQLVELEDGSRWFTMARSVQGTASGMGGLASEFVIGLGVAAHQADRLVQARGLDLAPHLATPIGLGCPRCTRTGCPQRSAPPHGLALRFDERERGVSPFDFGTAKPEIR